MARFTLEKPLPSCKVTRALLEALQRYLNETREKLQSDCKAPPDLTRLSISLSDDLGTEIVESTDQLRAERFLDSTSEADIAFDASWYSPKVSLDVRVRFRPDRRFSRMTIESAGQQPRELAVGVYQTLSGIIETERTSNWRYHPPLNLEFAIRILGGFVFWIGCGLIGWILGPLIFVARQDRPQINDNMLNAAIICVSVGALVVAYLWIGKRLHPYTLFDSSRAERSQKRGEWFDYGLVGFLLFSSAFTFLRRSLFGF